MDNELYNEMNADTSGTSVVLSLLIGMLRDNGTITGEQLSKLFDIKRRLLNASSVEERHEMLEDLLKGLQ